MVEKSISVNLEEEDFNRKREIFNITSESISYPITFLFYGEKEIEDQPLLSEGEELRQRLAISAKALLADYKAGGELTVFTELDTEDFYEQG